MSEPTNEAICKITDEAIARRAYEIWESRGCPAGDGSENWEAAKSELLAESQTTDEAPHHLSTRNRGPLLRLIDRLRNRAASL